MEGAGRASGDDGVDHDSSAEANHAFHQSEPAVIVLRQLDPAEEEVARTLGAGPFTTFRRVILPALAPAIAVGALQTFARAVGEFGSVVIVSGNLPHRTMTAPIHIFGAIESGEPHAAAAVSVVLVAVSVALFIFAEHRLRERSA